MNTSAAFLSQNNNIQLVVQIQSMMSNNAKYNKTFIIK